MPHKMMNSQIARRASRQQVVNRGTYAICISNTNGDKQSGGDPFWENSERLLYTALIALLRDWFPPEDYSLDGLLTLLSMAEAKENDENFKSPLDMIFDEIETGKVYERNPFYQGPSTSSSYADAESDRMAISENTTDEFTWQSSLMERNNDGLSPAREGGLTSDQDFALANYKMFKVAAGKTLKSIIISCNVRMAPMRIEQVRELLKYDEMNLDEMGDPGQRTAVFAIMSDTDKTFSFLHAIMMWQSISPDFRSHVVAYLYVFPLEIIHQCVVAGENPCIRIPQRIDNRCRLLIECRPPRRRRAIRRTGRIRGV